MQEFFCRDFSGISECPQCCGDFYPTFSSKMQFKCVILRPVSGGSKAASLGKFKQTSEWDVIYEENSCNQEPYLVDDIHRRRLFGDKRIRRARGGRRELTDRTATLIPPAAARGRATLQNEWTQIFLFFIFLTITFFCTNKAIVYSTQSIISYFTTAGIFPVHLQ